MQIELAWTYHEPGQRFFLCDICTKPAAYTRDAHPRAIDNTGSALCADCADALTDVATARRTTVDEDATPRTTVEEIAQEIIWTFDGDEARWPPLVHGLSNENLRLALRTVDSVRWHFESALSLVQGLSAMLRREQENRDASV